MIFVCGKVVGFGCGIFVSGEVAGFFTLTQFE